MTAILADERRNEHVRKRKRASVRNATIPGRTVLIITIMEGKGMKHARNRVGGASNNQTEAHHFFAIKPGWPHFITNS